MKIPRIWPGDQDHLLPQLISQLVEISSQGVSYTHYSKLFAKNILGTSCL